jgi:hypothetical protein
MQDCHRGDYDDENHRCSHVGVIAIKPKVNGFVGACGCRHIGSQKCWKHVLKKLKILTSVQAGYLSVTPFLHIHHSRHFEVGSAGTPYSWRKNSSHSDPPGAFSFSFSLLSRCRDPPSI